MVDTNDFKAAMGSFPAGVVIATTIDADGKPWGFTASSFSSVSLDPPLVLVCLADSAECFEAFRTAKHLAINILPTGADALAKRFASRGADKFAGDDFITGAHGLPLVRGALANLVCSKFASYEGGDHDIIVGRVEEAKVDASADAMVFYRRAFWSFPCGEPESGAGELKPV